LPIKLTKRSVDTLESRERRQFVYDSELRGFGVEVTPAGTKTFFVQYRTAGGRRGRVRRYILGRYGVLTVDKARKRAREILGVVAQGVDPAIARQERHDAALIRELGKDYLEDVLARNKPRTYETYAWLWDKYVLPAIGNMAVADVTPADVAKLHRKMRPRPYAANRALAVIGSFFSYAERQGGRAKHTNPAHEVEAYEERARERYLTPAEVKLLGDALGRAVRFGLSPAPRRRRKRKTGSTAKFITRSADTPKPANPFAIAAIRFLLLSGWRESEALTLRWSDVDFGRRVALLPDTKTGRSARQLGAPALALLEALPRIEKSQYVFPGRDPENPLVEINRVWYAVRHAAGLEDVRLHDLRHSFASVVASAGGSLLMVCALLGHKDVQTSARYTHLFEDPVKAVADATAGQLASWLSSSNPPPFEIVPIARARSSRRTQKVVVDRRERH